MRLPAQFFIKLLSQRQRNEAFRRPMKLHIVRRRQLVENLHGAVPLPELGFSFLAGEIRYLFQRFQVDDCLLLLHSFSPAAIVTTLRNCHVTGRNHTAPAFAQISNHNKQISAGRCSAKREIPAGATAPDQRLASKCLLHFLELNTVGGNVFNVILVPVEVPEVHGSVPTFAPTSSPPPPACRSPPSGRTPCPWRPRALTSAAPTGPAPRECRARAGR